MCLHSSLGKNLTEKKGIKPVTSHKDQMFDFKQKKTNTPLQALLTSWVPHRHCRTWQPVLPTMLATALRPRALSFPLCHLSSICKSECISYLQKVMLFKTETRLGICLLSWCHCWVYMFFKVYFQDVWRGSSAQILLTKVRDLWYFRVLCYFSHNKKLHFFCLSPFHPWPYGHTTAVENVPWSDITSWIKSLQQICLS